jgi:hypothetical protein
VPDVFANIRHGRTPVFTRGREQDASGTATATNRGSNRHCLTDRWAFGSDRTALLPVGSRYGAESTRIGSSANPG